MTPTVEEVKKLITRISSDGTTKIVDRIAKLEDIAEFADQQAYALDNERVMRGDPLAGEPKGILHANPN